MFAKGMSLIEVLIASFILGTGILCMLSLQASALGVGVVSEHRQQASLLLMELAELVYINPVSFREIDPESILAEGSVEYDVAQSCLAGSQCTPSVFATNELHAWVSTVRRRLPDARIDIQREWQYGYMIWKVNVNWHGSEVSSQNSLFTELQL